MKKTILKILIVACLCVMAFSGYKMYDIYSTYEKIDREYEELSNEYTSKSQQKDKETGHYYLQIDWDNLLKRCPDVKGWIQIPDTNVDYPILQGKTNEDYIHKDLDGNYLSAGSIFIASENEEPFVDVNTVIYGHNMKNGSMFNNIKSYTDQQFADEHPYVYVYLPDGSVNVYKVVAAHIVSSKSELYKTDINDYQVLYQEMLKTTNIHVDFDTTQNNPVISLSTCTSQGGGVPKRNMVNAVLYKNVKDLSGKMDS